MGRLGILMLSFGILMISCGGVCGNLAEELQKRVDDLTVEEALVLLQDYNSVLNALKDDSLSDDADDHLKDVSAIDSSVAKSSVSEDTKSSAAKDAKSSSESAIVKDTSTPKQNKPVQQTTDSSSNSVPKVATKVVVAGASKPVGSKKVGKKISPQPTPPPKKMKKKKVHHKSWIHRWVGKLFHGRKTNDAEQQQRQQKRERQHEEQQQRDSVMNMLAGRVMEKEILNEETRRNAKKSVKDMKDSVVGKDEVIEESEKRVAENTLMEKDHKMSEVHKRNRENEEHASQDQEREEKKEVVEQQQRQQQQDQQRQQQQDQQQQQQQRRQLRKRESKDVLSNIDFTWSNKRKDDHREQQNVAEDFPFLSFLGKREIANDVSEYDELRDLDVRQIARALVAKRRAIESALLNTLDDRK